MCFRFADGHKITNICDNVDLKRGLRVMCIVFTYVCDGNLTLRTK